MGGKKNVSIRRIGAGAAAVIAGTLWYKLRNYTGEVKFEFNKQPAYIDQATQEWFNTRLQAKGIEMVTIKKIEKRINNDLSNNIEKNKAISDFSIHKEGKILNISIEKNGEKTDYEVKENNKLIGNGSVSNELNEDAELKVKEINNSNINEISDAPESTELNYSDNQYRGFNLDETDNVNDLSMDGSMSSVELGDLKNIVSNVE